MQVSFELEGRFIFFATNNVNKFKEARRVLAPSNIAVGMLRIKSLEIQSESLEEIAKSSVLEAFQRYKLPLVVEDSGLFVEALKGFPGPYAAYVYRTLGNEGILKFMEKLDNRKATFKSVIAYISKDLKSPVCFEGAVKGEISRKERRAARNVGFGFDPIFKPDDADKTFAEMNTVEKCECSHRAAAFRKFGEWYKQLSKR